MMEEGEHPIYFMVLEGRSSVDSRRPREVDYKAYLSEYDIWERTRLPTMLEAKDKKQPGPWPGLIIELHDIYVKTKVINYDVYQLYYHKTRSHQVKIGLKAPCDPREVAETGVRVEGPFFRKWKNPPLVTPSIHSRNRYWTTMFRVEAPVPLAMGVPEAVIPISFLVNPLSNILSTHLGQKVEWKLSTHHVQNTYMDNNTHPKVEYEYDEEVTEITKALLEEAVPSYLRVSLRVFHDEEKKRYSTFASIMPRGRPLPIATLYEKWVRRVLGIVDAFIRASVLSEPALREDDVALRKDDLLNARPYEGSLGHAVPVTLPLGIVYEQQGYETTEGISRSIALRILGRLYPKGSVPRIALNSNALPSSPLGGRGLSTRL